MGNQFEVAVRTDALSEYEADPARLGQDIIAGHYQGMSGGTRATGSVRVGDVSVAAWHHIDNAVVLIAQDGRLIPLGNEGGMPVGQQLETVKSCLYSMGYTLRKL